eukprot:TRINITY_DN21772_c0_g1_i1.p1 TRINITY_DN21772_c0_g1~~TRINITY_DN21772_c0_g1_i1.p1  ORF type:complete len:112 (+),score=0.88 TRINITY_DN21772_c0_g1_i1:79-414(+)
MVEMFPGTLNEVIQFWVQTTTKNPDTVGCHPTSHGVPPRTKPGDMSGCRIRRSEEPGGALCRRGYRVLSGCSSTISHQCAGAPFTGCTAGGSATERHALLYSYASAPRALR